MKRKKLVIAVMGPTAVGKTKLAISIAKRFSTEIISADARQFYKELTIGTAKPSRNELVQAKHHFINNLQVAQSYTVGDFETEALEVIEKLFLEKNCVVVVGGSGLYIKALLEGLDDIPSVEPEFREKLNLEFRSFGLKPLLDELELKDPDYFKEVDKDNPVRVIRALEVIRGTNMPFTFFRKGVKKERSFQTIKIGLNRDRVELYKRIDDRVEEMLQQGLEVEVKQVVKFKNENALQTVGYKEVFDFLEGRFDYNEMIRLIKRNTRRYAKRQLTWFNRDEEIHWFNPDQEEAVLEFIHRKIDEDL